MNDYSFLELEPFEALYGKAISVHPLSWPKLFGITTNESKHNNYNIILL